MPRARGRVPRDDHGLPVREQRARQAAHRRRHVIAHNTLQYGKTGILGEGIAVWLNGQRGNHHTVARELLEKGELPTVSDLVVRFREAQNNYTASGSFCGFLLNEYGLEVFKQIYPLTEPSARLKEPKGKSFEELEPDWHAMLARH